MNTSQVIEIRQSHGGRGVFAAAPFAAGARILEFAGERVDRATVARAAAAREHDGFLQISADVYLGRSGGADDYVNHGCNPNCYAQFAQGQIHLAALREIEADEELFFDYGLTQINFPFRFHCQCGDPACRGEIGNYDEIPSDLMSSYRARRVVARYIERALDASIEDSGQRVRAVQLQRMAPR